MATSTLFITRVDRTEESVRTQKAKCTARLCSAQALSDFGVPRWDGQAGLGAPFAKAIVRFRISSFLLLLELSDTTYFALPRIVSIWFSPNNLLGPWTTAVPVPIYVCPRCGTVKEFGKDAEYRTGSNRFCPKDGTLLRPQGWASPVRKRTERKQEVAVDQVVVPAGAPKRKVGLSEVVDGMTSLEVTGVVVSKRSDRISKWRAHAIAEVSDGTATVPLNLWRNQVDQVRVGDRIFLKQAFARTIRGRVQLSTWEDPIKTVRPRNYGQDKHSRARVNYT